MGLNRFRAFHGLVLLLAVAVFLGGGGANYGLLNFCVQLVALFVLALRQDDFIDFWRDSGATARLLIGATLLLPIVQAIPLPPGLWQSLPGRDLVTQSVSASGYQAPWLTLSIDGRRTLLAATGLIAPLVALVLATRLKSDERRNMFLAIVVLAGISFLVGSIQAASGNRVLDLYATGGGSELRAFFANRNSTGLFFVISLISLVAVRDWFRRSRNFKHLYLPAAFVLGLGVILTQSRSSTLLLVLGLIFLAVGEFGRLRSWIGKNGVIALLAVFLGAAALGIAGFYNDRIGQTLTRYDDLDNMRWNIWSDTIPAIRHYWPVGSGFGTYRETSEVFESLESVSALTSGRAHNDFLETALEGGIFSIILLAGWFVSGISSYVRASRTSSTNSSSISWKAAACALALVTIALQSMIDYPLRNQTLLCVAAALFGVLMSSGRAPRSGSKQ